MNRLHRYTSDLFSRSVPIYPLVTFRIVFGLLMLLSLLRFWWLGWIDSMYIEPKFHFTYMGFGWVHPPHGAWMYVLFAVIMAAALCITLGLLYRFAAVVFFLGFTWVELIDASTYLNHYYFISLVAFLLIWLPANREYSLDVWRHPQWRRKQVPAWCVGIIRFQMGLVYVFAGLAKLNSDWLLEAQPMRTWLPAKSHLPIVGQFMYEKWVAYLFSWFGAAYDLFIVFFLLNRRTRIPAYFFVVAFHGATAIFFPGIGMFPYVMIACSLIFFSANFHQRLLSPWFVVNARNGMECSECETECSDAATSDHFPGKPNRTDLPTVGQTGSSLAYHYYHPRILKAAVLLYVIVQLIIPLRFLLYPGKLFWNEEGFRFSWRVMLMEKSGAAYFTVKDKVSGQVQEVNNREFLIPLQEKMMSTQPDMILSYAHFLGREYKTRGFRQPEVYGTVYVALNGRRSRLFIDSTVNLLDQPLGWKHYSWVLP